MSLDLLSIQDEIITKLKELPQDVYETTAPDDSKLKFDPNGTILPYIVVEFSDLYPGIEVGGIISTRYDVGAAYMIINCVGPTQRSARQVAGIVRDKIVGFVPNDAGEIRAFGGSVSYTNKDSRPNRFVSEATYIFPANTVW